MTQVAIKEVNKSNESEVRKVRLKPDQETFIESVAECLEEAKEYPQWQPVAIYSHDKVVGFAMYGSFGPNKDTWIDRIIIDKDYQGLGLGSEAMRHLIEIVSKRYGIRVIYLSIVEGNEVAAHLYNRLGFEYMNEKDPNGERIYKHEID